MLMMTRTIDNGAAWTAFEQRDRSHDGHFVGAVLTTGIYCKPSCPARHPKRENVIFYPDGAAARAAGFRACMRCRPDEVGRDREAVAKAVRLIEKAEEMPLLGDLAAAVGYRRITSSACSRAISGCRRRPMRAGCAPDAQRIIFRRTSQ